ncbi:MAG: SH3 domain-containing protein [Ruminococcus sp.]
MNLKKGRLISVIIAAAIFFTSGIIFTKAPKASAADAVLQQYDSEWGSYPYGDGTLADSGCGAFAIINAVRYLTGNTIDIYDISDWATANEYIWGVGSSFSIAPDAAAKYGSTYGFQLDTHIGFSSYVGSSYPGTQAAYDSAWNTLVAKLSQGEVAVGLVENHFIAIVDYDSSTGNVLVYDPGAGSKRQTTRSGDWKSYDDLNYWSDSGSSYLKLRAYLTFYYATGASSPSVTETTPAFSGSADAAGTYIVSTAGGELNLRGYATTSSAILAQIPNGTEVEVIESDGSWASVIYNGISGYCSMQYLKKASQSTTAVSETTAPVSVSSETSTETTTVTTSPLSEEYAGTYIVNAGGFYLNMRKGPDTSYDIVVQIPDNEEITVSTANDNWACVSWNGYSGYCAMQYLKKAESASVSETTTETTTEESSAASAETTTETTQTEISDVSEETENEPSVDAGAYRVNSDGAMLNLRSECSMDSEILAQIPDGSEVFVISTEGEWAHVSWKNIEGCCKLEYLSKVIIDAEQSTESIYDIDPAYATIYGDANLDGKTDLADAVLLHKALTGAISLNKTSSANADCYLDGKLSTVDAAVIIQYIIMNCTIPVKPAV